MSKRPIASVAILALTAGMILGGGAVAVAGAGDPCDLSYTKPMNSTAKLKRYNDCRFDRLERKIDALGTVKTGPTSSPTRSQSPTAPTTASSSPRVTASPTATGTGSLSLTAVDGGTSYYSRWSANRLPADAQFFPIGVWMEQGGNAARLAGYGVNLIVNPVGEPSGDSRVINLMHLEDEADMWGGPGDAAYTGNMPGSGDICVPADAECGYSIMRARQTRAPSGTMRYANYGKGVAFWATDGEASRFVNDFQDVTSADVYWGTDQDVCQASQGGKLLGTNADLSPADCRKPSNYGKLVDRVRNLTSPKTSRPVYNYVELGHPGTNGIDMPVDKIRPAVWSSLIHEARGIVYFNHSFGGVCQSQHVLDDCDPAIARTVTSINAQIKALAPVLNSPKINGITKTGSIDALAKYDGKNIYVFTGSNTAGEATSGSVTVPTVGDGTADVIGENRTVAVVSGKIADSWANSNAVHLYKIR